MYVLLIGGVWDELGAYVERRESTLSTRKQIGASRENGHWWRGKRYAKPKDIGSEDG